jgi:hypothetical protein
MVEVNILYRNLSNKITGRIITGQNLQSSESSFFNEGSTEIFSLGGINTNAPTS